VQNLLHDVNAKIMVGGIMRDIETDKDLWLTQLLHLSADQLFVLF